MLRLWLAALLCAAAVCAHKPPKDYTKNVGGGLNLFSEADERAMGQRYAAELDAKLSLVGEGRVQAYVDGIGRRLAAASLKPGLPYRIRVVNTKEVNAFAVPGGFLYLNRGLIELTESEGQLAGVLAHEMAHVVGRHGTKQMSKQLVLLGVVAGASAVVGKKSETWANVVSIAGGLGALLATMKYSRDDEHQADALAAHWMARAGYDPGELAAFFAKMDPSKAPGRAGRLMVLAGTHPPTADRVRNVLGMALQASGERAGGEGFMSCKTLLAAVPAPPPGKEVTLGAALAAVSLAQASVSEDAPAGLGMREEAQRVLDLPGNTVWQAARMSVEAGQLVEVWAEGEIALRKDAEMTVDPSGMYASGRGFFKPIPALNTGALLGRIVTNDVSGPPFPIGTHRVFRAPTAGRLELGINDDNNFDNRGGFRVWILTR